MPVLARVALSLLSGACFSAAFPGPGIWLLAPVGVALLAIATCGARARLGLLLGFLAGALFLGYSLSWAGTVVGVVPWLALTVLQALFLGALGAACAWLQGRPRPGLPQVRPVAVALAWVAQEALRDRVPYGGFPWVRLAFSQADSPLGRLAALGGAPLVTAAVALVGGLLAAAAYRLVVVRWVAGPRRPHPGQVAPGAEPPNPSAARALVCAAGAALAGAAGLAVPLPTDGTPASVMAVQGNVPRPGLEFNAERRQVLDNHVRATVDAAAQVAAGIRPKPDLVVWPENSSDIDPTRNPDARAQITRALLAVGAPLVVGTVLEQPAPDVSNASLLYLPQRPGSPVAQYVKQHPVPFAEYIPSRDFFRRFSDKVDLVRADFVAGDRPVVFRVPAEAGGQVVAGPSICFEVAYDDLVRANVDLGANLLLVQTNNATFGYSDESVQQLAISRIRAMEHGRSVVHVSTVGVSGLITPDGTVHQPSALFTQAVLTGTLPLRSAPTVATMVGPWPEYAMGILFVALLLAGLRPRARTDRPRPTSDPSTDPTTDPTTHPTTHSTKAPSAV